MSEEQSSADPGDDAAHRGLQEHGRTHVRVSWERAGGRIDAAQEAGLGVKVNTVLERGVNEHQLAPMAEGGLLGPRVDMPYVGG